MSLAYHVCHDNRHGPQGASFLCTNGTIFNQETFNCDWWFNVDCNQAVSFYSLNSDPNFNPYFKKPAEVIQYKSENLPKLHKPKLASNLLLESQVSPTFSKSSWPEAPTFPNFMFFSSEKGHPEPANPIQKNVLAPVVSHPPGEVKARTKVERTASFSAPKTIQDSENRFSNDAGRPEIKSERTILPSGSKQSFEMEEKIEKSQEILRKFEDSSESINIKKKSTILPTPSPSGRRVLRRRKRPRPNGPISATVSESTRRKSAYKKEPKSEISDVDIPEGAILDFEWGQRTS
ncbi:hypothetical protein Avbf_13210 [Armadillidium vulgare]|nr:hypothetical protein Avbf_13210 [Armadillidium vulgare]